jgi:hypothetical protein
MAMGADVIVAQPLTITGSIGVVLGKFNLEELYRRIGYTKTPISRGRCAPGRARTEQRIVVNPMVHPATACARLRRTTGAIAASSACRLWPGSRMRRRRRPLTPPACAWAAAGPAPPGP